MMMKAGAVLSLLLCLVAVSQGREILGNPEMNGCEGGQASRLTPWTGSQGSYSNVILASIFTNTPAGDLCNAYLRAIPGVDTLTQIINVPKTGLYDFTALSACNGASTDSCVYTLTIDGNDVPLTDATVVAVYRCPFLPFYASGIPLKTGAHTLVISMTYVTGSSVQAFLTSAHLVSTSSGSGDPHMVGFQGQQFDYIGEPGQVVNLVTDPELQVNTLLNLQKTGENSFIDGPMMMEMAFMTRGHTVIVNAGGHQKEQIGFVTVDGVLLPLGHSFLDGILSIVFTALNTNSRELGLTGNDHIVAQVDVKLEGLFEFRVFMIENIKKHSQNSAFAGRFLDFNASLLDLDRRPHGVLGQTAAPLSKERSVEEWTIEGKDQDYVVKDGLTGSQFAFNQFN